MIIRNLWEKSKDFQRLSFFEKYLFKFLCIIEKIYCISFFLINFIKLNKGKKHLPYKVLSLGNISSGGTGKSVITRFLIENVLYKGAVILRGYKSGAEKANKGFLVSDGENIFCDVSYSGDEAYMLSRILKSPIVIGKKRYNAALLLNKHLDFVVLDDAYQNHQIKKDLEILLLDARSPFENGHCLPAGKLREKDISRADIILLTHSDKINNDDLLSLKNSLGSMRIPVFSGLHKPSKIVDKDFKMVDIKFLQNKKLLVFAGIGSFNGFLESLNKLGLSNDNYVEYPDHHSYSVEDIKLICNKIKNESFFGVVTTFKDIFKILPILDYLKLGNDFNWYCLDINFEFLTKIEKDTFLEIINEAILR
ncbi:tetraacyldisaccharide 4'-kinase [Candidatus Babeliales bacterium]|nr:tetraacyldisaccharide 4'-kinase [Candidatus Babeliales bacterium]